MRIDDERRIMASRSEVLLLVWLAGAVVAVAIMLFVPSISSPLDAPSGEQRDRVEVSDEGTELWPYVAAEPSFEDPRGSINVVFYGDHVRVRYYLMTRTGPGAGEVPDVTVENESAENATVDEDEAANESDPAPAPVANGTSVAWTDAYGANRYTYVERPNGTGTWIKQRYQLHYGDYFGKQYHLRVFEPPEAEDGSIEERENWTAVQAHSEHWDWFVFTHTVDGLEEAQSQVELDFMGRSFVSEVHRDYFYNGDTYDADGWTTVVRLAVLLPALGLAVRARSRRIRTAVTRLTGADGRNYRYRIALLCSLALVVLGVRAGGIVAERFLPLHRYTIRRVLYPFLICGVPLCAYAFGRRLRQMPGFLLAFGGFAIGVLLDYAYLNVTVLPIELVAHRFVLATAVGLIGAGATVSSDESRWNRRLVVGLLLWTAMVVVVRLL